MATRSLAPAIAEHLGTPAPEDQSSREPEPAESHFHQREQLASELIGVGQGPAKTGRLASARPSS